jgi:hypothetical protein
LHDEVEDLPAELAYRGVVNASAETFAAVERRQAVPQRLARGIVLATRERAHEPFWRGG